MFLMKTFLVLKRECTLFVRYMCTCRFCREVMMSWLFIYFLLFVFDYLEYVPFSRKIVLLFIFMFTGWRCDLTFSLRHKEKCVAVGGWMPEWYCLTFHMTSVSGISTLVWYGDGRPTENSLRFHPKKWLKSWFGILRVSQYHSHVMVI